MATARAWRIPVMVIMMAANMMKPTAQPLVCPALTRVRDGTSECSTRRPSTSTPPSTLIVAASRARTRQAGTVRTDPKPEART